MGRISSIALLLLMANLSGCSTNSTSDLIDDTPVDVARYSTNIQPIIAGNCVMCHSNPPVNGAPISLTSYELVKDAVMNHGLLDRISRPQGAPGMMPNGGQRLPQPTIDLIVQWQADGFPQ